MSKTPEHLPEGERITNQALANRYRKFGYGTLALSLGLSVILPHGGATDVLLVIGGLSSGAELAVSRHFSRQAEEDGSTPTA